jgi:5'/3'-nucleotidase SurE
VSWVLLGNDDGIDSPALLPFADALEEHLDLPVQIAVPDGERSWSGKAVTRGSAVSVDVVQRGDRRIAAVSGTPADAIQLGLHGLFEDEADGSPPRLVVTGVNLGFNAGSAFLASSGTVWAAAEAAYAGMRAVAVSTGSITDFVAWREDVTRGDEEAASGWRRVTGLAAAVVASIDDSDLHEHCDLVSVNAPWEATDEASRVVTTLSHLRYGPLFEPTDDPRVHRSRNRLAIDVADAPHDGDVVALGAGTVSITPVVLPRSADVPHHTRQLLER